MSLSRRSGFCVALALLLAGSGCRGTSRNATTALGSPAADRIQSKAEHVDDSEQADSTSIRPVANKEVTLVEVGETANLTTHTQSLLEHDELSLEALIPAVIECNPTMQAAHAAWGAAAERYPQVIALEDPMLQTMFAPASFASNQSSQSSYYLGLAQRVPWNGKRRLKGQAALWEASAAACDVHETELRLAAATRIAYFDYYLVQRELELNQRNVEVMQDFRSAAKRKYESGQVSQQDLTTADLELAKLDQQRLELSQQERIAIARINTLLHRRPNASVAPSVKRLTIIHDLPDMDSLLDLAVEQRPELSALAARVQAEQNAVALACKEYYPDFEFMGRYDSFWNDSTQRPQVGMNMNVPVNRSRRAAAVREAQFKLNKLTAELALQQDTVREEVQIAHAKVDASLQTTVLFEERTLPAAAANLSEARAAYVSGSIDFLRLMEARRQSTDQQIGYQRALAELHRSRADLERAVGTAVLLTSQGATP